MQITVKIRQSEYDSLKKLSSKTHKPIAEIVRGFIRAGMSIESSKDDIDFIRKQLREELDIMLKPQVNRLAKLLMRIGMMTISFCYFNSKIIENFVPFEDMESYEELMTNAKHSAAAYLNMRDAALDAAFKEFEENNL